MHVGKLNYIWGGSCMSFSKTRVQHTFRKSLQELNGVVQSMGYREKFLDKLVCAFMGIS